MSQTEVQTVVETGVDHHPLGSIPLYARSHHSTLANGNKADIELTELERQPSAGTKSLAHVTTNTSSPPVDRDQGHTEDVAKAKKWKAHVQFATLCLSLFMAGWNDGTTGPLLPRIQEVYHVSPRCSNCRGFW